MLQKETKKTKKQTTLLKGTALFTSSLLLVFLMSEISQEKF